MVTRLAIIHSGLECPIKETSLIKFKSLKWVTDPPCCLSTGLEGPMKLVDSHCLSLLFLFIS